MNSDDFFAMEELPEKMVVIGGGYIGVELAQILQALGVKVTLLVRTTPLKFVDKDIIEILLENMTKLGLDVRVQSAHEKVVKNSDGKLTVHLKDGSTIDTDKCLLAMGRPPNLAGLELEKTSIQVERGAIYVD